MGGARTGTGDSRVGWTFLTHHAMVLVEVSRRPDVLIRELAEEVGLSERRILAILRDLVDEGYVELSKQGRRNSYRVRSQAPLRHPLYRHVSVGQLVAALTGVPGRHPRRTSGS